MSDYYELLQVPRDAGDDTIKKSYRRLARLYHPDSNKARFASEHMTLLNAAYGVLSDPLKRRLYDAVLAEAARRAVEPPVYETAAARPELRHSAQPVLLWIGVTAVLIVIAFSATLYTLRSSIPAFNLALFSSPTRIAIAVPPTRTPTATREASPTPSLTPTPTATAPHPTTTVPPTPTLTPSPSPLPVVSTPTRAAYPLPLPSSQISRIVRTEFPNGPAGAGDIVVANPDGSIKTNLTRSDGLSELSPSWSPDGRRIVYSELNSGDLFVIGVDGGAVTRLTSDAQMRAGNPVWAPVGALIAYESLRRDAVPASATQASRVFVIDSATRQKRQIGDFPGRDLTWSPDARWLAYQAPSATGATIYITAIDTPAQQYFFSTPHIRRLAWTPDARRLAYEAFVRDTNGDGRVDELDAPEISVLTIQPFDVKRLAGTLSVVSVRGSFPGPGIEGEIFPPILSTIQQ